MSDVGLLSVRILERATELINHNGDHWIKGEFQSYYPRKDGRYAYCALGAINQAEHEIYCEGTADIRTCSRAQIDAKRAVSDAIYELTNGEYMNIPSYNDAPTTTYPDIVKVFDKAIRRAIAIFEDRDYDDEKY